MRLPRYSMRALLVLIFCVSALLAVARDRLSRDREAGAIIEKLRCSHDNQLLYEPGGAYRWLPGRPGRAYRWLPAPLVDAIWPRYLNGITSFGVSYAKSYGFLLHDNDLRELSRLQHLHVLHIYADNADPNEPLTDVGINSLGRCRELVRLTITSSAMTDAALEAIGNIKTLRSLGLASPRLTGVGLHYLEALPVLVNLDLSGTAFGDEAIESIVRIRSVRVLHVGGTRITAAGGDRLRSLLPKTFVLGPRTVPVQDLDVPPEAAAYSEYY